MPPDSLIAIIMATKLEAVPFLESFSLEQEGDKLFPVYRNSNMILIVSGIGKGNAAIATTYAILRYNPAWCCTLGAAGAVKATFALGDVCHIDKVIEYDRPHLRSEALRSLSPFVLPGFPTATIATQDKPVINQKARKAIARCADLVDMEAAGVLQASARFDVSCVAFKFVSDTLDHERHDDIVANIRNYRESFCNYFAQSVLPMLKG
jgi:nucleoside phosphorylase